MHEDLEKMIVYMHVKNADECFLLGYKETLIERIKLHYHSKHPDDVIDKEECVSSLLFNVSP